MPHRPRHFTTVHGIHTALLGRCTMVTFLRAAQGIRRCSGYCQPLVPKPPPIAHQPMKFLFTKTAVFERSLVDGKSEPVAIRRLRPGKSGLSPSQEQFVKYLTRATPE